MSTPAAAPTTAGRPYTIASLVLAVGALAVLPPLLGAIGVVLGLIARRKGDPLAVTAIACCVAATVIGLVVAAVIVYSG